MGETVFRSMGSWGGHGFDSFEIGRSECGHYVAKIVCGEELPKDGDFGQTVSSGI
jgi:hypothetical protein